MDLQQLSFRKTRIAPTPSGYLHMGNILSFALTAWLAQQTGAAILLRIDDLDRQRMQRSYVEDIFETLQFLNIPWHEGPRNYEEFEKSWSQLHRLSLYNELLQQLVATGQVFACNCSRAQLSRTSADSGYNGTCNDAQLPLTEGAVNWRLRTTTDAAITINTLHGRVEAPLPTTMKDIVIRKKDGYPAYQLSSVADDRYYEVDLIVRGADLWPSTLAQTCLAAGIADKAFTKVNFHHHGLLMRAGEEKLSKSAGATSIQYLRKQGNSAAEVCKMIARAAGIPGEPGTWQSLAEAFWMEEQRINPLAQKNI
ncbi:glutamate--tRNA ligase family protein [Filimonas effusa]|uniref:tRNA glutamyl-Q synthetase n=1 Tax=Filimonas effusa TaxID=2508721 RepID=A0A4Q1D946_9BACT|nr:glutamate--tRNA ligase family protein [Filimonas effusa]RXK85740.1 tRNA glutamyl-Q synthetase [Filimonas effusa]